jgi:uncharacterized protein
MPSTDEVLIFAKYPEKGRCKTRLAKDVGEDAALKIYQALLKHTCSTVINSDYKKILYIDPACEASNAMHWAPCMDLYLPQAEGDLGARLSSAVQERFVAGANKLLLLGSDCPLLSKSSLVSAFSALESCDVVLGPTEDGGYYLLGLKKGHTSLFQDIPWSTDFVFEKTLNILKFHSLSYIALETFSDVDTLDDYRRLSHLEPLKYLGIR